MNVLAEPVVLNEEEREILVELLDRERSSLAVEIHHSRTAKFRDGLRHRFDVITTLMPRLKIESPE